MEFCKRVTRVTALAALVLAWPVADARAQAGLIPSSDIVDLPYTGLDPTRKWLAERGFTYGGIYTGETMSNLAGGLKRGTVYQGKGEGFIGLDFDKFTNWRGLSFFANAFQINGTGGISRNLVGNIQTISNIEALSTTRLSEMWFEQKFFNDTMTIRAGQLVSDTEFFYSKVSEFFPTSDWPAITAVNWPSGGPAYPLSTPGVRIKIDPNPNLSWLTAVFNGDPAGPGPLDPEIKNSHGINFRMNDAPVVISELIYRYNQGKDDKGLSGNIKLGAWYHSGQFDSQRFASDGRLLADPTSTGVAKRLRGNQGIYTVVEQQLYRPQGGDADSGINTFLRASVNPSDRNLIAAYLDGGIVFSGFIPGRPNDKFGASFLYSKFSGQAAAYDRDFGFYTGQIVPVHSSELSFELAYMIQMKPWWTLQPDFQYVIRPSGIPTNNYEPSIGPLKNASIFTIRSVMKY
ncbi:porin B precursor [Variibacter gotjawalensis]|uniref:Porin B n=1 Tax=Variibacter gotjawalensis TaxID=1333996 RepID=A0A0S3PVX3_9BRAD|nr:OprB family porin [Variibacter gotjawalensis]BAT60066.1 porin B precursor [Variibacter gotjawalensis]